MRSSLLAAILLFSIVFAVGIGALFLLRGPGSTPPIESLPRDTSLVVRVPDPSRLLSDVSHTALAPGGEGQIREWLDAIVARAVSGSGLPAPSESAIAPIITQAVTGETLIALVPGDHDEPAGLAIVMQLGRAAAGFPELARRHLHETETTAGDDWVLRTHHGREYVTLHPGSDRESLSLAGLKGLAFLTTSGGSIRRIIDTLDGRAESIRSEPAYRATQDQLGRRADLFAYVSGRWIAAVMQRRFEAGSPSRRALKLLGLDAARGAGLEVDVRRDLFHERMFIALSSDRRGLTADLFDAPPRDVAFSRMIPAGFPFYLSLSWSGIAGVYRDLPEILSGVTGEDRRAIRDRLEGLEKFMAIDPERDLLGALGSDVALGFGGASLYPRGAPNRALFNTPAVAAMPLRSRTSIKGALERLDGLARAMAAYRSSKRNGQSITVYEFPAIAPLMPSYRVLEGQLVAATSPDLLYQAIDASVKHLTFADRADLAPLLRGLPDKSHLFFVGDTSRLIDFVRPELDPVTPGAVTEPLQRLVVDLARRTDLSATAATCRRERDGLLLDWLAPVSPALWLSLWTSSTADAPNPPPSRPTGEPIPF